MKQKLKVTKKASPNWQSILTIIGGIIAAAVSATAFTFGTFQTKVDSAIMYEMIKGQLNRLEDKVDTIPKRSEK